MPPTTPPGTSGEELLLPTNLIPSHYNIQMKPDLYGNNPSLFKFEGSVEIFIECKEPTDKIILHVQSLNISDVQLTSSVSNVPSVLAWTTDKGKQFLVIKLNADLLKGQAYVVSMKFVGPLKKDFFGLYLSTYKVGKETK